MPLAINIKTPIPKEELDEGWITGWKQTRKQLIAALGQVDRRLTRRTNAEPTSDEEHWMELADTAAGMTFDLQSDEESKEGE